MQWEWIWLGTMRLQVRSLALFNGLRIRHCHELWCKAPSRLGSGVAMAVAQASRKEGKKKKPHKEKVIILFSKDVYSSLTHNGLWKQNYYRAELKKTKFLDKGHPSIYTLLHGIQKLSEKRKEAEEEAGCLGREWIWEGRSHLMGKQAPPPVWGAMLTPPFPHEIRSKMSVSC